MYNVRGCYEAVKNNQTNKKLIKRLINLLTNENASCIIINTEIEKFQANKVFEN